MRLFLASASPRRAELLRAAGFDFETLAVQVDERVGEGEAPAAYVRRLAAEKSAAGMPCASTHDGGIGRSLRYEGQGAGRAGRAGEAGTPAVVLGADTVVVVDGAILGKPADAQDSFRMLRLLAGRQHEVLTGVSIRTDEQEVGGVDQTRVVFAPLSTAEVAWYVQSGEGADKAGAYAIQGLGSRFVERIEGSYSNVVGLPIVMVYRLLREVGVDPTDLASGG